uniref:hypothetical protein n=1 Tax=Olsenella uli TaxID=133926 RepID=UPI0028E856E0|nr:hypothetical protein [Olsenella uli]
MSMYSRSFQPFGDEELRLYLGEKANRLKNEINGLSGDTLHANTHDYLVSHFLEKYQVAPIVIEGEDISLREQERCKINKRLPDFERQLYGKGNVEVEGVRISFHFPFKGDPQLFHMRASTFSLSGYREIELAGNMLIIRLEYQIHTNAELSSGDQILKELEGHRKEIDGGIAYVNNDVDEFNSALATLVETELGKREDLARKFEGLERALEIPLTKAKAASSLVPLKKRKTLELSTTSDRQDNWCISDDRYQEILGMIKNFYSTCERTPETYSSLDEEALRDLSLASLNSIYKGRAGGETFRHKGKTDISIEADNRAAFVAECKMWNGEKKFTDAIAQLLGYLTWRDVKTALIVFSRKFRFDDVLTHVSNALQSHEDIRSFKRIDKNEFDCQFVRSDKPGQITHVRVLVFDLYSE